MGYEYSIPVVAEEDLSALEFRAIEIDGTLAASNGVSVGILQNKPKNGEDATLSYFGRSRFRAGAAVTKGDRITVVASGWVTGVNSNQVAIGTALQTVTSGGIAEGIFNFIGARSTIALTEVASNTVGFG